MVKLCLLVLELVEDDICYLKDSGLSVRSVRCNKVMVAWAVIWLTDSQLTVSSRSLVGL